MADIKALLFSVVIITFSTQGNIITMCNCLLLISIILGINSFTYDEKAGWDIYARSFPVTKKQIVLSKYLFVSLFYFAGVVLAFFLAAVERQLNAQMILELCTVAGIVLLLAAIMFPMFFKFNAQTAFVVTMMLIMAVVTAISILAIKGLFIHALDSTPFILLLARSSVPVGLLFWVVSYFISCKIYESKCR